MSRSTFVLNVLISANALPGWMPLNVLFQCNCTALVRAAKLPLSTESHVVYNWVKGVTIHVVVDALRFNFSVCGTDKIQLHNLLKTVHLSPNEIIYRQ